MKTPVSFQFIVLPVAALVSLSGCGSLAAGIDVKAATQLAGLLQGQPAGTAQGQPQPQPQAQPRPNDQPPAWPADGEAEVRAEARAEAGAETRKAMPARRLFDFPMGHPVLDACYAVSGVLNVQVVDDSMVVAGGATVNVRFTGTGTHWGAGPRKTWIGVYDGGWSGGSCGTRQVGAIAAPPAFTSQTDGSVDVAPAGLAAGSFWLRLFTEIAPGTWEVSEGVLMVH